MLAPRSTDEPVPVPSGAVDAASCTVQAPFGPVTSARHRVRALATSRGSPINALTRPPAAGLVHAIGLPFDVFAPLREMPPTAHTSLVDLACTGEPIRVAVDGARSAAGSDSSPIVSEEAS